VNSGLKRAVLAAVVASVALFGCGGDGAGTVYLVTVSSVGSSVMGDGSYESGATVFIVAGTPPAGYKFDSWTTASRGVNFDDAMSSATWFTMPANDVTVTANFLQGVGTPPGHTHFWGDWVVTMPATCNAVGVETRTCRIDASHKETRSVPKLTGAACNPWGWNNNCISSGSCRSAVMPDGKRWMIENLNIVTAESWCYNNNPDSCSKYGRLYTWYAAKAACPSGWHLPTYQEWDDFVSAVGEDAAGKKLKSKNGWNWNIYDDVSGNGTDDFGFSAMPGGCLYSDGKSFFDAGSSGHWWTATEDESDNAYYRLIDYAADFVYEGAYNDYKSFGFSVRCVQN